MHLRLGVIITVHNFCICAALIALVVMFIVQNDHLSKSNAENIALITLERNLKIVSASTDLLERLTLNSAIGLKRFGASAENLHGSLNFSKYVASWYILTLSASELPSVFGAFEMWRARDSDQWSVSGCWSYANYCFYYDRAANITYYIEGNVSNGNLDPNQPLISNGPPTDYERNVLFLQEPMTRQGRWSPLCIDASTYPPVYHCGNVTVHRSMTFFTCMEWVDDGASEEHAEECRHVVATKVEQSYIGEVKSLAISPTSSFHVFSPRQMDNVNGACDPPPNIQQTVNAFISSCHRFLTNCHEKVYIGSKSVSSALGMQTPTELFFVLVDVTPRQFFFDLVDQNKTISIAVSVVVIVVVMIISVLVWMAIVLPIRWICRSMKRASTLAEDRGFRRIGRYTIIAEVRQLYGSYQELRQALKDLKAFVPQGLFVAPSDDALKSNSVLDVLMTDEDDANSEKQERCVVARPWHGGGGGAPEGEDDVETEVTVFSDAEDEPVHDSDDVDGRKHGHGVSMELRSPSFRANTDVAFELINVSGSHSRDRAPMELKMSLGVVRNRFRRVTCSFMTISFCLHYADTASLESEVATLMNATISTVLACGGVIEVFRPNCIVVSFGAHSMQSQHAQLAAACALKVMRRIPTEHRSGTQIIADSGDFFVGNCGSRSRVANVVFGDRFDFMTDLFRYDIARGRVVLTDSTAMCLPSNFVVPMDNIIPLRNRIHGIQLFHLLDPAERRNPMYQAGADLFRLAYRSAIEGNYVEALEVLNRGAVHDAELGAVFTAALTFLCDLKPKRPRYCRFQLPHFEPLGVQLKEQASRYYFPRLCVEDLAKNSMPSINFDFAEDSPSGPANADNTIFFGFPETIPVAVESIQKADESLTELPMTFVDQQGAMWSRLPSPIGSGAFAEVYKAVSQNGAVMALKCIRLSSRNIQLEDVVREVNTACKLSNEHVVNYTSWAHVGPFLIIIMDFMSGGTVQSILSAFPSGLTVPIAKRYASSTVKGLAYLHKNSIIHADLKPQNILITKEGDCKISDFGSSVTKANALFCSGDVFNLRGTPLYMSPEVAGGAAPSMSSDIWSFGITLFHMLTGRFPWVQKRSARLRRDRRPTKELLISTSRQSQSSPANSLSHSAEYPRKNSATSAYPRSRTNSASVARASDGEKEDEVEELVDAVGQSDVSFVMGLANKSIVACVREEDLPCKEAFDLILSCLRLDPAERPHASEIIEHPFFIL